MPVLSKNHYLFIGNPGGGKSTILNGLAGTVLFKSGEKVGSGVTVALQQEEIPGKGVFMDTPGLAETRKEVRDNAAAQITDALRKNGNYRIFFVITLEAGRVRPADVATISLVTDALKNVDDICYSIIINKLSSRLVNKLEHNIDNCVDDLMACLMGDVAIRTNNIFYMEHTEELFGTDMDQRGTADDQKLKYKLPEKLQDFIVCAPRVIVDSAKVEAVKADLFEDLNEKFKAEIDALKGNLEQQQDKNAKMQQDLDKQAKIAAKAQEQAKADRDRFLKEVEGLKQEHEDSAAKLKEAHDREQQRLQEEMRKASEENKKYVSERLQQAEAKAKKESDALKAKHTEEMNKKAASSDGGGWTKYVDWIPVAGPVISGIARLFGAK